MSQPAVLQSKLAANKRQASSPNAKVITYSGTYCFLGSGIKGSSIMHKGLGKVLLMTGNFHQGEYCGGVWRRETLHPCMQGGG